MYRYQIKPFRTARNFDPHFHPRHESRVATGFSPKTDVFEDSDNYYFTFEIPGLTKEHVKLSVNEENILTIKGEKKIERKDGLNFLRRELSEGEFERSFYLPEDTDSEKIKAKFENGVLNVTIPKLEEIKKEIEIDLA